MPITMGLNRRSKRSFFAKVIKNVQDIGRSTQFLKFSIGEVLAYYMRREVPRISIPFVGEATQGRVSYEFLLNRPIVNSTGKSWLHRPWNSCGRHGTSVQEDKNNIIAVQWLVAIITSYLVFVSHDWSLSDPLSALLVLMCLASATVLQRIPDQYFEKHPIELGLLLLNSILVVSAITLSKETPWDLLLLFFFCVFIAAIGENLIQIGVGCVLLSLAFLVFLSPNAADVSAIEPNFLMRVPFMFGISIFYGHLASQVKREKRQVEKMEESMRLKRQFVCALAHDIKTPLNVILGHAELLAEGDARPTNPADKLFSIQCIRKNIENIVKLITDLLAFSKLETLKLDSMKNLVQMNAIAEDVVLGQMVTARDKNLNLTLDLANNLKPMLGDNDQMQRALGNLVGNAIKFTPSGGSITVTSEMIKNDISLKVTDTGCGIPEEELSGLFCEFKRLKGTANIEGTGLGLFIVKTIVETHNGTVAVESKEGAGTTFTISLPAAREFSGGIQAEYAHKIGDTEISREGPITQYHAEEQSSIQ